MLYSAGDLDVIIETLKGLIAVALPVAIGLLALILGVDLVPTIIKKFRYGGMYDSDGLMLGEWEDYYNEDGSRKK